MAELSVQEQLARALARPIGSEERLEYVRALRALGSREAFEAARDLVRDMDLARRVLGLDVLSQLRTSDDLLEEERPYRDETITLLLELSVDEADPDVLRSLVIAAGHLGADALLERVLALTRHPDAGVRWACTWALDLLASPTSKVVVDAFVRLAEDEDDDVREWAWFALATAQDGYPVSDASARRVFKQARGDADVDVRCEALSALALLGDQVALCQALEQCDVPRVEVIEAAGRTGDPAIRAQLVQLLDRWPGDPAPIEAVIAASERASTATPESA